MAWMLEHSINVAVSLRKLKHNIGIMTIVILPDGFPNRVHQISLPNTELALAMCEAISSSLWISLESKLPNHVQLFMISFGVFLEKVMEWFAFPSLAHFTNEETEANS
ncbi:uncharacterized protein ACOB8E_008770 isoform 2-T2 [Sarcophilus harrisii]